MLFENNTENKFSTSLEERELLGKMAKVKDKIQSLQLWIDDARTNRIARIRYDKVKKRLRELVEQHKGLSKTYTKVKGWT